MKLYQYIYYFIKVIDLFIEEDSIFYKENKTLKMDLYDLYNSIFIELIYTRNSIEDFISILLVYYKYFIKINNIFLYQHILLIIDILLIINVLTKNKQIYLVEKVMVPYLIESIDDLLNKDLITFIDKTIEYILNFYLIIKIENAECNKIHIVNIRLNFFKFEIQNSNESSNYKLGILTQKDVSL
jgi:hypothetical protein